MCLAKLGKYFLSLSFTVIGYFPFYFVVSHLSRESLVVFGLLWFFFFFFCTCILFTFIQSPRSPSSLVVCCVSPMHLFLRPPVWIPLGFITLESSSSSSSPFWFVCFAPFSSDGYSQSTFLCSAGELVFFLSIFLLHLFPLFLLLIWQF